MALNNFEQASKQLEDKQRTLQQKQTGVTPAPPGLGFTPPGQMPRQGEPIKIGQGNAPPEGLPPGESPLWGFVKDFVTPQAVGSTAAQFAPSALEAGGRVIGAVPHPVTRVVGGGMLVVGSALNKLPPVIRNTIMGSLGGGAGEAATGGSFTEGAITSGAETLTGETATRVGGRVIRRVGGAKLVGGKMAKEFGDLAGKVSGGALKAGSVEELAERGLYGTAARKHMSRIQDAATVEADSLLPRGTTFNDPTRPVKAALWNAADQAKLDAFLTANNRSSANPADMQWLQQRYPNFKQMLGLTGGAPPPPKRYTLAELDERLQELGEAGYPRLMEASPTEVSGASVAAKRAREDYRKLREHIKTEMHSYGTPGVEAFNEWDRGRSVQNAGRAMLEVIEKQGWLRPGKNTQTLDLPAFQKAVRSELDNLRERLAPEDFKTLKEIVWRGAHETTGDVKRAAKNPLYYIGGSMKYTGAQPFTPGEQMQILVNGLVTAALEGTGLGAMGRPEYRLGGTGDPTQTMAPQPSLTGPAMPPSSAAQRPRGQRPQSPAAERALQDTTNLHGEMVKSLESALDAARRSGPGQGARP